MVVVDEADEVGYQAVVVVVWDGGRQSLVVCRMVCYTTSVTMILTVVDKLIIIWDLRS